MRLPEAYNQNLDLTLKCVIANDAVFSLTVGEDDLRLDTLGEGDGHIKATALNRPIYRDNAVAGGNCAFCPVKVKILDVWLDSHRVIAARGGANAQRHCGKLIDRRGAPRVALATGTVGVFTPGSAVEIQHLFPALKELGSIAVSICHLKRTEEVVIHGERATGQACGIAKGSVGKLACLISRNRARKDSPNTGVLAKGVGLKAVEVESFFLIVQIFIN